MKNLKRLLTLLLALCLALSMASFSFAAEPERSGTVGGSDVTWSLSSSGRLTIAGSGDTERFTSKRSGSTTWRTWPSPIWPTGLPTASI